MAQKLLLEQLRRRTSLTSPARLSLDNGSDGVVDGWQVEGDATINEEDATADESGLTEI